MSGERRNLEEWLKMTSEPVIMTTKEENAKYSLREATKKGYKALAGLHFNCENQILKLDVASDIFDATMQIMFECHKFLIKLNRFYSKYLSGGEGDELYNF